ncbi:MAG: DUF1203 domain-containing protein [Acidimicrobiales bacterium]|jgi:hypothetical protein
MTETLFFVEALPTQRLEAIRRTGFDDAGNTLSKAGQAEGGEPLRCCLRLAEPGEQVLLIAYRPFDRPGPYAETGPVFVHAAARSGYGHPSAYPEAFRDRPQVFRAYDADGVIVKGELCGAKDSAEDVIAEMFEDDKLERIHTRNVLFGCYMLQIRRTG